MHFDSPQSFEVLIKNFNSRYGGDKAKLTLGLAGFYGYGNYGDELFLDVWAKYLADEFNLEILHDLEHKPYFSEKLDARLQSISGIIIGGGDILQPWNIDERYWNSAFLNKPIWIAGVGVPLRANSAHQEKPWKMDKMNNFLCSSSVRMINVRDKVSYQWCLDRFECPEKISWCPDIVSTLQPHLFNKIKNESSHNLGVVVRSRKGYEQTDDFSYIEGFVANAHKKGWTPTVIILGTGRTLINDLESSLRLDITPSPLVCFSNSTEKITECIMKQDALISMKFHGSVAGLMAGIPSIVGVPTLKNREFTKYLGVPDLCIGFESPALLVLDIDTLPKPTQDARSAIYTQANNFMNSLVCDIKELLPFKNKTSH